MCICYKYIAVVSPPPLGLVNGRFIIMDALWIQLSRPGINNPRTRIIPRNSATDTFQDSCTLLAAPLIGHTLKIAQSSKRPIPPPPLTIY